ncbi:MAG: hypothetical protein P4L69_15600 [Desulfosporosinus sp.]|nr:hypothetical protein [Desulfosporosinus sp.]
MRKTKQAPAPEKKEIEPYKIFNSNARAFMRQLDIIFPHETNLVFIKKELEQYSAKECKKPDVPALRFYKSMSIKTGIKGPNGVELLLGDMILNHDERLFAEDSTVTIPELSAIDLKAKWKVLDDENRETIWAYLEKMAKVSCKVASLRSLAQGQLDDIANQVRAINDKLPAGMSEEDKIKAILADPMMANVAMDIKSKLGEIGLVPTAAKPRP